MAPSSVVSLDPKKKESGQLDFIGSSVAVKDIFSVPYAVDRQISVAVHNVGGTLLIEADDDDGVRALDDSRPRQRAIDGNNVTNALVALSSMETAINQSEALTIVNNIIQESSSATSESDPSQSSIPRSPEPREYLNWKFHDMNMLVGSEALIYRSEAPTSTALTVRVEDASKLQRISKSHQAMKESGEFVPDHQYGKLEQVGKPSYANATKRSESLLKEKEDEASNRTKQSFVAPNLDRCELKSCIVPLPSGESSVGRLLQTPSASSPSSLAQESEPKARPSAAVSTVLDTYLDNIMANVPQLALCLQEKGFIQSVKLLNTDEIPSQLMQLSTVDTSVPFETIRGDKDAEKIFSPEIMEMNAHALLRFLKTNCNKDNATYLLRRDAGRANIQLYDISSISAQKKQKWLWWLAMMSYKFSNRLRHLSMNAVSDKAVQRSFRVRQRSLLQNTFDLLEMLADMQGHAHESLIATVCENLADTFLVGGDEEEHTESPDVQTTQAASPIAPAPQGILSHEPYAQVSVDALQKAQDHLSYGIKILHAVLAHVLDDTKEKPKKAVGHSDSLVEDGDSSDSDDDDENVASPKEQIDPVVTQLIGLHLKLVNVSLRLAEIHLQNYWSSHAMQSLRTAANRISDGLNLIHLVVRKKEAEVHDWLLCLQLKYTWLWEQCGYFARAFAADSLWRERGHMSGDDVVSVLLDVEAAFSDRTDLPLDGPLQLHRFIKPRDSLSVSSHGSITFSSLSGLIRTGEKNTPDKKSKDVKAGFDAATSRLSEQKTLQRDERHVLVAASLAYSRAVYSLEDYWHREEGHFDKELVDLLRQRLGDSANETGKVMLNELRSVLVKEPNTTDEGILQMADAFSSAAEFWFIESLHSFEFCRDLRNLALIRCNLCQCYKLRANSALGRAKGGSASSNHSEDCLQIGIDHLVAAHDAMEQRDADPATWDMVSTELAATLLVLGVRRRQTLIGTGNLMFLQRLAPGKEKTIVDPMQRALAIYEQMGSQRQAAATHYQLAQLFSKIWTCQRDETKTREKLAAAFQHYKAAASYFSRAVMGDETTFCLLCLDIASLYSSMAGEEGLSKAVQHCLDTAAAFTTESMERMARDLRTRMQWFQQMNTIAESVEERTFKFLQLLVKLESTSRPYKDVYRAGLTAKMATQTAEIDSLGEKDLDDIASRLLKLRQVLLAIRGALES